MKLVRFDRDLIGVVRGNEVFDVTAAVDDLKGSPLWMQRFCSEFDRRRPRLEAEADRQKGRPIDGVTLLPPMISPSKIIAAKANYHRHAMEMADRQSRPPSEPDVFLKAPSTLIGPGGIIRLPAGKELVEHEAELAVLLKRGGKDIKAADAMECVLGYSAFIDVSVREPSGDLSRKKSYDTFGPLGPCIVTADEIPDPHALSIRLWVNESLRQDGKTADMVLKISDLIEFSSKVMTLCPGDLIATGTPEGVGPLKDGDRVIIEIERIGTMSVSVKGP
jgi:2-keto-4-pentenoate hydratase/2-oxohepta-3-ene-1,7-dioic acid hydratase in catechol pathway